MPSMMHPGGACRGGVRAHHARLVAAGLVPGELTTDGRGLRFYVRGPDGLVVEVSTPART